MVCQSATSLGNSQNVQPDVLSLMRHSVEPILMDKRRIFLLQEEENTFLKPFIAARATYIGVMEMVRAASDNKTPD